MATAFIPEGEAKLLLHDELSLAAVAAPNQCMFSGSKEAIAELIDILEDRGVTVRRLFAPHAFHSYMMRPLAAEFAKAISKYELKPPNIRFISCVTGDWITDEQATSHQYWADQFCEPVRFAKGMETLFTDEDRIFLEVGPERTLNQVALQHPAKSRNHVLLPTMGDHQRGESEVHALLTALGRLWLRGVEVDWHAFHQDRQRYRVPLPSYPFEHSEYWIEAPRFSAAEGVLDAVDSGPKDRPWKILTLAGRSESYLENSHQHFLRVLQGHPHLDLGDVAYTLHMGRQDLRYRRYLLCRNLKEAVQRLETGDYQSGMHDPRPRAMAFMFSGQGSQYAGMGADLYKFEPIYREEVDRCWTYIREREPDFYNGLSPDDRAFKTDRINQTYLTQPALFIVEYAMAKVLLHWGLRPQAMIGHSIGEYVAACLTGVFSLEDALSLVIARGRLMQSCEPGDMLSVRKPEAGVLPYLNDQLSVAVINSPKNCVISGTETAIADLSTRLSADKIACQVIRTSHAFHSHMMEPILDEFIAIVGAVTLRPPRIPFVSNVTGTWITEEEATDPGYWARHLRGTVRFAQGLEALLREPERVLIESGPGNVLTKLAKGNPARTKEHKVFATMRHPKEVNSSDISFLLNTTGQLWLEGFYIDWDAFNIDKTRATKPMLYFDGATTLGLPQPMPDLAPDEVEVLPRESDDVYFRPNVQVDYVAPVDTVQQTIAGIWREYLGLEEIGVNDDYFELGGDSMLATQLIPALSKAFNIPLNPSILMQHGTIATLAEFVNNYTTNPDSEQPSVMVRITKCKRIKRPLFMVHPIGGDIFFYRDMARILEKEGRPVYAFQAPSLMGVGEPVDDVKTQAGNYVDELLNSGPEGGPFLLGGSSYGGIVAFEMAVQLIQRGHQVPLVIIVDAPAPGKMPPELSDSAAILEYLLDDKLPVKVDTLRKLDVQDQIRYIREMARAANQPDPLPESVGKDLFPTWLAHQRGMFTYKPSILDTQVLYFRHSERMSYFPPDAHEGWEALCADAAKFQMVQVPGTHITMNFEPQVQDIVKVLKRTLSMLET
jgi:malonyl CoA-acyl carrier protein transacylase/thioesterase domain-containing protein/acyl carrier protein